MAREYAAITANATAPIIAFPWHDYGPTTWNIGGNETYTLQMFETVIGQAAADGAEFVTGIDLADRIASFGASSLTTSRSGSVLTASVTSSDAGQFALDVSSEGKIASVTDWYAYDDNSVFLPRSGGTFDIALGATPADLTHINDLGQRNDLILLSGNGADLNFDFAGQSDVQIDLQTQGSQTVAVTGADSARFAADGDLVLSFNAGGQHSVALDMATATAALSGGAANDILIGGTGNDTIRGQGGNDLLLGRVGDDILEGGLGDDRLEGGTGNDTLRGQGGQNTFVFRGGDGADAVDDFVAGADMLEFWDVGYTLATDVLGGFSDSAGGATLSYTGGSVQLSGVSVAQLDVNDIFVIDPLQIV